MSDVDAAREALLDEFRHELANLESKNRPDLQGIVFGRGFRFHQSLVDDAISNVLARDALAAIRAEASIGLVEDFGEEFRVCLDVIDGIVDDTHPEGDGCPLCVELDALRDVVGRAFPEAR